MVFFTCDGCNETLKKNQVDGHANRCRRCDSVSCVDCSISFYGDDYRSHTTCTMSEKDNLVTARGSSKKQTPQEAWMEMLHLSVDTAPAAIKRHLQQMVQLNNIPRKEKQFRNFASNSLNLRGNQAKQVLDAIWNYLNEQREKLKQQKAAAAVEQQKQKERQQEKKKEEPQPATAPTITTTNTNKLNIDEKKIYKSVKKATKKMLKKAPNQCMKYKSLQKALREDLGVSKKELKLIMDKVVAKETKKIQLEGKQIKLVLQ